MFIKGASPIALLHAVASECSLQYASLITEIASDQTILCGVELELPPQELMAPRREFFFWEPVVLDPYVSYAKACVKAVSFLQKKKIQSQNNKLLLQWHNYLKGAEHRTST